MASAAGTRFSYLYDFGDTWERQVLIEEVLPAAPGATYPRCPTGRGACPPEDVGGVWGYQEFLKTIRDPQHEEHASMLEWVGGRFDPTAFDVRAVNQALAMLGPRPWDR